MIAPFLKKIVTNYELIRTFPFAQSLILIKTSAIGSVLIRYAAFG